MKKRLRRKSKADLKAFLRDFGRLDWKLILIILVVVFVSLFVSEKVLPKSFETGVVFGIQTELFEKPIVRSSPVLVPPPANYPTKTTNIDAPQVSALSAIVMDVDSQVILYEKAPNIKLLPASTTKIMTALVGLEYFNPDDVLSVPFTTAEGANMGLVAGEAITFQNLLYGLLLNSGNDAAETIAQNFPGGKEEFIGAMNKKALALNLSNTHFQNATGLEVDNHFTTAIDLSRLASAALKNPVLAKIVATKYFTVSDISGTYIHPLENVNQLLGEVNGVIGIKTGYTQEAGQVLVAAATRDGNTILTVVLRSDDRFADSRNLLEWAFENHKYIPTSAEMNIP